MTRYFHLVSDWFSAHPNVLTLVLFGLATAATIYSPEIRRFLHQWPRTKKAVDRASYNISLTTLGEMQALHGNSYNLILWLAFTFTSLVTRMVQILVAFYVVGYLLKSPLSDRSMAGIAAGLFVGQVTQARRILWRLVRYDQTSTNLKAEIEQYERENPKVTTP